MTSVNEVPSVDKVVDTINSSKKSNDDLSKSDIEEKIIFNDFGKSYQT